MGFLLVAVYAALLFLFGRKGDRRVRQVYIIISLVAIIMGVVASVLAGRDHVGASLSGMVSIFMR